MIKVIRNHKASGGFSLLEVLIAVVVLSTGLLALAALQGSLTRSSADAKVRSRIAAALTTRMEGLRSAGYANVTGATFTCTAGVPAWLCDTESQAALAAGSLTVTQTVSTWTTTSASPFAVGTPGPNDPQFKRVQLTATWPDPSDPSGVGTRRLLISTDISPRGLEDGLLPPPDEISTDSTRPIARTDPPAAAGSGVIPVAMSATGQDTAATNPKPEIFGRGSNQSIVGTRFSVLTYTNESSSVARLQKRLDTDVIRCSCKYGAIANVPAFMRTAQWPAVWNGQKYAVYKPDSNAAAPGQAFASGEDPDAVGDQSDLCTACCRDHHDSTASPKFDPERSARGNTHSHYTRDNSGSLVLQTNTTDGPYLEVCRMVLIDGVMRTAADMYSRHFGLLETVTDSSGRVGATGIPNATKASEYGQFVKDALAKLRSLTLPTPPTGSPYPTPTTLEEIYANHGLAKTTPEKIAITSPNPADERYLNARSLYLDHLEPAAQQLLTDILADTDPGGRCDADVYVGAARIECILPYLPILPINVTELAFWQPENADPIVYNTLGTETSGVLTVQSASALIYDPAQPFRGRVNARGTPADDDGEAATSIGISNSGVAISAPIDPDEVAEGTFADKQPFAIADATTPVDGDSFAVSLQGLPQTGDANTSNDPSVAWAAGSAFGNCAGTVSRHDDNPNNYICDTTVDPLANGSITVSNYYREYTVSASRTITCQFNGTPKTITATLDVPTFANYAVTEARYLTVGSADPQAVQGTFDTPQETNSGLKTEATRISFAPLPSTVPPITDANQYLIQVTFGTPTLVSATVISCETNNAGNQVRNIVWSKPWE